jgi:hypothetical protein
LPLPKAPAGGLVSLPALHPVKVTRSMTLRRTTIRIRRPCRGSLMIGVWGGRGPSRRTSNTSDHVERLTVQRVSPLDKVITIFLLLFSRAISSLQAYATHLLPRTLPLNGVSSSSSEAESRKNKQHM